MRSDIASHARRIENQLRSCIRDSLTQKQVAAIKYKGTYAEFSGMPNFELATKSLESRQSGIRLLNVHNTNGLISATVYIPEGKEKYFLKRIEAYATEKTKNVPRIKI